MIERGAVHARDFGDRGLGDPQRQQGLDLLLLSRPAWICPAFPVAGPTVCLPLWRPRALLSSVGTAASARSPQRGQTGSPSPVVCRSCVPVSRRPSLRANTRICRVTKVSIRVMISPTERPSRLNSLTRSVSPGARRASKTSTFRTVADRREDAWSSRNSSTAIRSAWANSKMARR